MDKKLIQEEVCNVLSAQMGLNQFDAHSRLDELGLDTHYRRKLCQTLEAIFDFEFNATELLALLRGSMTFDELVSVTAQKLSSIY